MTRNDMKTILAALVILVMGLLLVACNSEDGFFGPGSGNDPAGTSSVASITLLTSSPQVGSGAGASATITAIVKDGNNTLLPNVPVAFSASSGALELPSPQPLTNAAGQVVAQLSAGGDYTNRAITVAANSGGISESVTVNVAGTSLSISGETSATIGNSTTLTISLTDSSGNPISNRTVNVVSALGNPLSASTLTTNSSGQVQVTVAGNNPGADTINATADGASASHSLVISGDQFQLLAPASGANIEISQCIAILVNWQQGGVAVSGASVSFSTTRGTLYSDVGCATPATSAVTNGAGTATLRLSSNNAGPATLTAFVPDGPSTSRSVNFIATEPHSLNLQASPITIGPNNGSQSGQQSTITATVRDADNNLVTGKVIRFSIIKDNSGGSLTNATAITNLQGRASTTYIPSSATTAKDGVKIRAVVDENTSINDEVLLTVAQSALFVRLGTGNLITSPTSTTYGMPYTVIVTDASGNAAAGVQVTLSVNPSDSATPIPGSDPLDPDYDPAYATGRYVFVVGSGWVPTPVDVCPNEDLNMNGILDNGEDDNSDGQLTPGNTASVPGTVTTGADGTFEFTVTYPRQFANWVRVSLTATTSVDGTESRDSERFWLSVAASDVSNQNTLPPGYISPFGENVCPRPLP